MPERIEPKFAGRPALIIGTGPSLDPNADHPFHAHEAGCVVFGVNNTWQIEGIDVHVTVNPGWWDHYMDADHGLWQIMTEMECWCSDLGACERWEGLHHFGWTDDAEVRGLSDDPENVALGHSSGFAALNVAYLMGCSPIFLIGYDMKFPDRYQGPARIAGGRRHYFGEYPLALRHWPSVKVGSRGELNGLIRCYERVAEQMYSGKKDINIINCTPGSAMSCFPTLELDEALREISIREQPAP